jgi:hypothetical protein
MLRPSAIKAIKAKCRNCMADYVDGRHDCEIPGCSLYWWMPYGALSRARKRSRTLIQQDETPAEGSSRGPA